MATPEPKDLMGLGMKLVELLERYLPKRRTLAPETVRELYQAMRNALRAVGALVAPNSDPTDEELFQRAKDGIDQLTRSYDRCRLSLPAKATRKLERFVEAIRTTFSKIEFHRFAEQRDVVAWRNAWMEADRLFRQDAKPAFDAAEKALRRLSRWTWGE